MNNLADFITTELEQCGWSMRELGRRAGVSHAQISYVVSGSAKPGAEFCLAIARAFHVPPEQVLRLGGLLPALPASEDDPTLRDLIEVAKQLAAEDRREVFEYATWRYRRQLEQREQKAGD